MDYRSDGFLCNFNVNIGKCHHLYLNQGENANVLDAHTTGEQQPGNAHPGKPSYWERVLSSSDQIGKNARKGEKHENCVE